MRQTSLVQVGLVLCAVLGLGQLGAGQSAPPTIHRVVVATDTGVLTITGTGLGPDLLVTVDGQPAPQLPGASATQMEVLAPVTLLTTAGTFRLTMVDPVRRVGDGFVVAGPMGSVVAARGAAPRTDAWPREGIAATASAFNGAPGDTVSRLATAPAPLTVIEDSGSPYRTAIGFQSLLNNLADGVFNTASGHRALFSNLSGDSNTASGVNALYLNTLGNSNTATGVTALYSNTTGSNNSAHGVESLLRNTTGSANTASGYNALASNTTGSFNAASGHYALGTNTTGLRNTASGSWALALNTTGSSNTASGDGALYSNTTGSNNSASGNGTLSLNTTGSYNTASGFGALSFNTTGSWNTASGHYALLLNDTGNNNTALGRYAGRFANTGNYNVFLGADVSGTATDTNTIRIGLPYNSSTGVGQTQTFIAGIHGTQLTGSAVQVFIDANGQLGTLTAPIASGTGTTPAPLALQQQVQEQQGINAELRATIADLRARLARLEATSERRR